MKLWQAAKALLAKPPAFNPAPFFGHLRGTGLRHRESEQVAGTNAILAAMHGLPIAWTAYALGTAWHETAGTIQPIKEYGGRAYFMRNYDITGKRPHIAKMLGNAKEGDGATYAGRGYVQLTGRANYAKAGAKLGVPLIEQPDLAMQPDIAARIMREGMVEGWFTGKSFATYMPIPGLATRAQFKEARRIINGTDRADKIAGYAIDFQAALDLGGWQ